MNFLLHMIAQPHRDALASPRPSPLHTLRRAAANAAIAGEFAHAAQFQKRLPPTLADTLILAQLQLAAHDYPAARDNFDRAIAHRETTLEALIQDAAAQFRSGRYVRAIDLFQNVRGTIDLLLSARAGLLVAEMRLHRAALPAPAAARPLIALAALSDLILRLIARTHLASNLARTLRDRDLREDLAPWATTSLSVSHLLQAELEPLRNLVSLHPHHSENNHRLALLARALGHLDTARTAFTRILRIHPHHVLSAARLAATLCQLERPEAAMPPLAAAFFMPAETLNRYHHLAAAANERASFDRAVERLGAASASHPERATMKANLAFALGEMDLLDDERSAWREPVRPPMDAGIPAAP